MKTTEIIDCFIKGQTVSTITQKQQDWLLSQSKRDGIKTVFDGFNHYIYLSDCHYSISACTRLASGGSYVGSRKTGKLKIEKLLTIQFLDTNIKEVRGVYDVERIQKEGIHKFKIINQL